MVSIDEQSNTDVNLAALDEFVKEFLQKEAFVSQKNFDLDGSGTHVRRAIAKVRSLIESGLITDALAEIQRVFPDLLQDQRILFWLKKQEVTEHLRNASSEARAKALTCLRHELAPMALNAYPEAYMEFKSSLLMLVYGEDDESPVMEEWSVRKRYQLASMVSRVLKHRMDAFDSRLCILLKYLLLVYRSYVTVQAAPGPVAELVNSLLLPERDPQLPSPDHGQTEFPEADVQSLAQPLAITRQEAVNALRYTNGNAILALKVELGGVTLATTNLNKIVWEYAMCRQLVGPVDNFPDACGIEPPLENSTSTVASPANVFSHDVLKHSIYTSVVSSVVEEDYAGAQDQLLELTQDFFEQHPQLFFDLNQCHFYKLLTTGQQSQAVLVARSELSAFVKRHDELLPKLKILLASLVRADHPTYDKCLADFSASLHSALRQHFGLSDPALVQLLCGLLQAHKKWHKHQKLQDRFETELGIDKLRCKFETSVQTSGDDMAMDDDGSLASSDMEEDDGEAGLPEQAILQTIEFSGLSRAEAIVLLQHHGGDPQAVLMHLFP